MLNASTAEIVLQVSLHVHRVSKITSLLFITKTGKGSLYSIAKRRVPELIPVLGSQPAGDVNKSDFPPGLQLPPQPLRGLLPVLLLGEQRHSGCEQFA